LIPASIVSASQLESIQSSVQADEGNGVFVSYRFPVASPSPSFGIGVQRAVAGGNAHLGMESPSPQGGVDLEPGNADDDTVHVLWWSGTDARKSTAALHHVVSPAWFPFETLFVGNDTEGTSHPSSGLQVDVWRAGERPIGGGSTAWSFMPISHVGGAKVDYSTIRSLILAATTPPRILSESSASDQGIHEPLPLAESSAMLRLPLDGARAECPIVLSYKRRYLRSQSAGPSSGVSPSFLASTPARNQASSNSDQEGSDSHSEAHSADQKNIGNLDLTVNTTMVTNEFVGDAELANDESRDSDS